MIRFEQLAEKGAEGYAEKKRDYDAVMKKKITVERMVTILQDELKNLKAKSKVWK